MTDELNRPPACAEPERRQFDFWIGVWDVHDPSGKVVGRNAITPLFEGCALREEWVGASGHRGTSLNAWSPHRRAWRQTWVDVSGLLLELEGAFRDGAMVLEGEAPLPGEPDRPLRHRITWSVVDGDPDRLRQHWETSASGADWETVFDGRYRRVSG
jgi:hypothetical protein